MQFVCLQKPAKKSASLAIAARERGSDLVGKFSFHTNFSFKVRAGRWEEAIAELNTATRFLESGALFLGHQQEHQMLQIKSRKVGGLLPVGVLPHLPLGSSQNASRTAGETAWQNHSVGKSLGMRGGKMYCNVLPWGE